MELQELAARFDERLDVDAYADLDASANGLQVGPDAGDVDHVAFAVDAAVETIERAADAGADLLVTHHGLVWDGLDRVTGSDYRRIAPLVEHDLALYAAHLPLDGHQELGNAAGLADLLDLGNRAPFGEVGPEYVGQRGTAPEPYDLADLEELLQSELETGDFEVRSLAFGPDEVSEIAVATGRAVHFVEEAADRGADVLVTGEGKHEAYHDVAEAEINLVLAGHYATETFGVRNLQSLAEEWGLETTYVSCPTGL